MRTPNPLQVTVNLEKGAESKSVIPVTGGTITALGADGTRFTLIIPANALLSDQEIHIIPVSSIDGLPLSGGLAAAVNLEPEGLLLFEPVTLNIELSHEITNGEFLGFSFLNKGEELFLYPTEVNGNIVTVQLMHFSGYGGGSGSSDDASNMDNYPPSSAQNQAMQAAANATSKAGDNIPYDEYERILRDWYNSSVAPSLKAATTDDKNIEQPITEFMRWATQVASCGLTDKFELELDNGKIWVSQAIKNAVDKTSRRCQSQSSPIEARRLIQLAAMAQLLGEWGGSVNTTGQFPVVEQAEIALEQAAHCAQFELKFDSIIETESGCQTNFISHVRATVKLKVDEGKKVVGSNTYTGKGRLEYIDFIPPSGCPEGGGMVMCPAQSTGKTGSDFEVVGATLFNINYHKEADSQPPNINIVIDPGKPEETMIVKCPDAAESVEVFKVNVGF